MPEDVYPYYCVNQTCFAFQDMVMRPHRAGDRVALPDGRTAIMVEAVCAQCTQPLTALDPSLAEL